MKRAVPGLILLFLFRLGYGLLSEFWADDEVQVYLIGLKSLTTGTWPFFGADVTAGIQVPGALQGLLVAVPLALTGWPEAPTVLLNILSFGGLSFFAWYSARRFQNIPRSMIWLWVMTTPWTMGFSTHVVNPSYALLGGILFFVALVEVLPQTTGHIVPTPWCWGLMGVASVWVFQLHLSWVLFPIYLVVAVVASVQRDRSFPMRNIGYFIAGCLPIGLLMIPTLVRYGTAGLGGSENVLRLNADNLAQPLTIGARFVSLASFEVPRFLGSNTEGRLAFLDATPWMYPLAIALTIIGVLQAVYLAFGWALRPPGNPFEAGLRRLTLGTFLLLYVSFWFTTKAPAAHTLYITWPVAMLYAFHLWSPLLERARWQRVAWMFLITGVLFHAGLGVGHWEERSLYKDRGRVLSAIEQDDYTVLITRRPGALY